MAMNSTVSESDMRHINELLADRENLESERPFVSLPSLGAHSISAPTLSPRCGTCAARDAGA